MTNPRLLPETISSDGKERIDDFSAVTGVQA